MVHGEEWAGREARLLRHPSCQSVPSGSTPGLCTGPVLCQPVDRAVLAASTTQGMEWCARV